MARARASGDVWSEIGNHEWPVAPYLPRCKVIDTHPGDELDLEISVDAGPNPPGPTRAQVYIKRAEGGPNLYSEILGQGDHTKKFVSPGGRLRVCTLTKTTDPYNWDNDDEIRFKMKHRRKKPNLVAHGPEVRRDLGWVGFGYSVENNKVYTGDATVSLYYAKRHDTGRGVALRAIRSFPIKREKGTREDWNTDQKFRVSLRNLGVPPAEATHLLVAVDIEKDVDEHRENDNFTWWELPQWEARISIDSESKLRNRPVTVFVHEDDDEGSKKARRVEPVGFLVKAEEKIWDIWRPARENHWVGVRVEADDEPVTGWVYTRHEESLLRADPVDIPEDRRHDPRMHHPVPGLREADDPVGRDPNRPPYVYVQCDELGQEGVPEAVRMLYLPPTIPVIERVRAELWRLGTNGGHDKKLTETAVLAGSYATYRLEWRKKPDEVVATVLKRQGLPDDRQPPLNAQVEPLILVATLNGRPAPPTCRVVLRVKPYLEQNAPMSVGEGGFTGIVPKGETVVRGWIFPFGRKKRLSRKLPEGRVRIKGKRSKGIPRLIAPVPPAGPRKPGGRHRPSGPHGVTNKQIPRHVIKVRGGKAKAVYLAPERGGADDLVATLVDISKPKKRLARARRHRIQIRRVEVPIVLVPGVMGTRMKIGVPTSWLDWFDFTIDDITWNPDVKGVGSFLGFSELLGAPVEAQARVMDIDGGSTATVIDENENAVSGNPVNGSSGPVERTYLDGSRVRNDGGCLAMSYDPFVRYLLPRTAIGPFAFPLYCLGYDWRQSNADSGEGLARQLETIISQTKSKDPRLIIITHSMGGLAMRSCLKNHRGLADRVLAAIHTFHPVTGAAVMYRRVFTGARLDTPWSSLDGWLNRAFNNVLGDTAEKFAKITSGMAGPFELLPGQAFDGRKKYTDPPKTEWIEVDGHGTFGGANIWSDYTSDGIDFSPPTPPSPPDNDPGPDPEPPQPPIQHYPKPPAFIHNPGPDNEDLESILTTRSNDARDFHAGLSGQAGPGLWKLEGRTWAIASRGHPTLVGVRFDPGPLTITGSPTVEIDDTFGTGDGDGTVPYGSAIALFPAQEHPAETTVTESNRQFVVEGAEHSKPYTEELATMPLIMRIIGFNLFGGDIPSSLGAKL